MNTSSAQRQSVKATVHDGIRTVQDDETKALANLRWRVMLGVFFGGALAMGVTTYIKLINAEFTTLWQSVHFWACVLLSVTAGIQIALCRPSKVLERFAISGVYGLFACQYIGLLINTRSGQVSADMFVGLLPWLSVIYVAAFIMFPVRWASWLVGSFLSFVGITWGYGLFVDTNERLFSSLVLLETILSSVIVVALLFFFKRVTEVGARSEVRALALETLANTDSLTGLHNRRYCANVLQKVYARAHKNKQNLSVVICDLDHFKSINDGYSHAVGDQVLIEVARLLQNCIRHDDLVSRHGGEEFVVVLPRTDHAAALEVCEKMRGVIESFDWSTLHPDLRVTASFGLCSRLELSYEAMLAEADKQLYRAKHAGRNCVISAHKPTATTV